MKEAVAIILENLADQFNELRIWGKLKHFHANRLKTLKQQI